MARDNQRVLAAARKAIEAERRAHKCYICGRRDLPRYARRWMLVALALFGLYAYGGEKDAFLGLAAVFALGGGVAAVLYESIKPDEEDELRENLNRLPHGG
jgi:hypothetical protein